MVLKGFGNNKNIINNSGNSSISIHLNYPEFQDCIEFNVHSSWYYSDRIEAVNGAVGCHVIDYYHKNLTFMSLYNITVKADHTKYTDPTDSH